ncbi:MAG: class I SAM-dependent methyltransferase [Candidatus Peribacteraceae bacterium]
MLPDLYDLVYCGYPGDVEFYRKHAYKKLTLYLGVGTGRIFQKIAVDNSDIIGIDSSANMKESFDLRFPHLSNRLVKCDFSVFEAVHKYDVIIAPFSFFNQFSKREVIRFLRKARLLLKTGGKIVTDFYSPFSNPINKISEIKNKKISGKKLEIIYLYDHVQQKLSEFVLMKSRKNVCSRLDLFTYYPNEIRELLQESGFKKIRMMGDYKSGSLTIHSKLITVEALK